LTPKHICEVTRGRARITLDMALRLELVLGRPAHFWTALQQRYDLAKARAAVEISCPIRCSAPLCDKCTMEPRKNKDLCPPHALAWSKHEAQKTQSAPKI
jgi:hypothetical protein